MVISESAFLFCMYTHAWCVKGAALRSVLQEWIPIVGINFSLLVQATYFWYFGVAAARAMCQVGTYLSCARAILRTEFIYSQQTAEHRNRTHDEYERSFGILASNSYVLAPTGCCN